MELRKNLLGPAPRMCDTIIQYLYIKKHYKFKTYMSHVTSGAGSLEDNSIFRSNVRASSHNSQDGSNSSIRIEQA